MPPLNYRDLSDPCWDRYKLVWTMFHQGKKYREIAAALGVRSPQQPRQMLAHWARVNGIPYANILRCKRRDDV